MKLHLEFVKTTNMKTYIQQIRAGMDEVCVLAGDIGNPYEYNYDIFMKYVNENFKRTFVIAGNHEYYNKTKTIEETNIFLAEYFVKFENICFLHLFSSKTPILYENS